MGDQNRRARKMTSLPLSQTLLLSRRGELKQATYQFEARLPTPRRAKHRLGLKLQATADCKWQIESKLPRSTRPSMVEEWNQKRKRLNPELRIDPGDRIVATNGAMDCDRIAEKLASSPRMTIKVEKDDPQLLA